MPTPKTLTETVNFTSIPTMIDRVVIDTNCIFKGNVTGIDVTQEGDLIRLSITFDDYASDLAKILEFQFWHAVWFVRGQYAGMINSEIRVRTFIKTGQFPTSTSSEKE